MPCEVDKHSLWKGGTKYRPGKAVSAACGEALLVSPRAPDDLTGIRWEVVLVKAVIKMASGRQGVPGAGVGKHSHCISYIFLVIRADQRQCEACLCNPEIPGQRLRLTGGLFW